MCKQRPPSEMQECDGNRGIGDETIQFAILSSMQLVYEKGNKFKV